MLNTEQIISSCTRWLLHMQIFVQSLEDFGGGHKFRLEDEGARSGWPNCFSEQIMNFHEFTIKLKNRRKITDFYSGKGIIASD